jgi:hypothetical protein
MSVTRSFRVRSSLHGIDGPEDQGETSNGTKESLGLAIFTSSGSTTIEGKLVDDDNVRNAGKCIPAPFLAISVTKSSKHASEDHDQISNDGNENVGTTKASEEAEIKEQEWGSNTPVDVTCIVYFTLDDFDGIWNMLAVLLSDDDLVNSDAVTSGHCEVGQEGKGGDESSEDMEEAFLLILR